MIRVPDRLEGTVRWLVRVQTRASALGAGERSGCPHRYWLRWERSMLRFDWQLGRLGKFAGRITHL